MLAVVVVLLLLVVVVFRALTRVVKTVETVSLKKAKYKNMS